MEARGDQTPQVGQGMLPAGQRWLHLAAAVASGVECEDPRPPEYGAERRDITPDVQTGTVDEGEYRLVDGGRSWFPVIAAPYFATQYQAVPGLQIEGLNLTRHRWALLKLGNADQFLPPVGEGVHDLVGAGPFDFQFGQRIEDREVQIEQALAVECGKM